MWVGDKGVSFYFLIKCFLVRQRTEVSVRKICSYEEFEILKIHARKSSGTKFVQELLEHFMERCLPITACYEVITTFYTGRLIQIETFFYHVKVERCTEKFSNKCVRSVYHSKN